MVTIIRGGFRQKLPGLVLGNCMLLASCIAVGMAGTIAHSEVVSVESRLRSDPDLTLFTKAMDIAYFWGRLSDADVAILFVPTDSAMAVEGSDFLLRSVLMTDENRQRLEALVSAHIVVGSVQVEDTDSSVLYPTMSGDCLEITWENAEMKVGPDATVISDEQLKDVRVITVDKLLIPDYRTADECMDIQAPAKKH